MVIHHIKKFFADQKKKFAEKRKEKDQLESFRETEEMRKAEEIKREADRLAQLKQYKTAIEEYGKALEIYPFKGSEENLFKNAAEFLFKCNYNTAACYSYLDDFDKAIAYFDRSLQVQSAEDENKVRSLMGKGSVYYRKKLFVDGRYKAGAYRIAMDSDYEVSDNKVEEYKKEDHKKNFIKMAHECFTNAAELDRNHVDAWYSKGHMEFLMGKIKEAVQSFDSVISISKNFDNKEGISLFDEIKVEKGIQVKTSEIMERMESSEPTYKAKTGHLVRTRAEMMIANFLFDNNLLFQYNNAATWADKDDFRASFYVPKLDLYIDHHPYDYLKEYQKVMKLKIKQYEKHKKRHVYLTSEDEKNIEESLRLKMKPYIML
ncbi:tetratricopeptide repeat protein [Candidatus Woesearchaeota archaeon]|nr:tetratricopeptide repeat protein [Candidatus Woesearchaeota archaeon]